MTPEQLANIQARADAATEGPWKAYDRGIGYEIHHAEDWAINDRHRETFTKADAEFITAARTDVPALLALVREQAAKLERVEALAEKWRYKGEFGWGAWQEGHGPDQDGLTLDHAAGELRAALTATEGA